MDKRNFKEGLKFEGTPSMVSKTDEYLLQMSQYVSEKLEKDAYEIVSYLREFKKQLEKDENIDKEQKKGIRESSSSENYFYSLSFEISHLEKGSDKSFEKSFREICEKYKVDFNEITIVLQELQELQNNQNKEEIKKYMQTLDDRTSQYFKGKNEEQQQ